MAPGAGRPRLDVVAGVLVIIGGLLLLQSLGVLPWGVWGALWRFWPVLLILFGVNLLWGKASPLAIFAITILALLVVVFAAIYLTNRPEAGAAASATGVIFGLFRGIKGEG